MFKRLAPNGRKFEEETRRHINQYSDSGLRTLVLAYRVLDEKEYKEFNEKLNAAKASVSADRDEKIEQAADSIERDLILLGATAVEDKLQQGVCRTAGEAPISEIFIKRGKKTAQTSLARCQTAEADLKRPKIFSTYIPEQNNVLAS